MLGWCSAETLYTTLDVSRSLWLETLVRSPDRREDERVRDTTKGRRVDGDGPRAGRGPGEQRERESNKINKDSVC